MVEIGSSPRLQLNTLWWELKVAYLPCLKSSTFTLYQCMSLYTLQFILPPPRGGIKRWWASDVCLSHTSGLSREQPKKTKIGTEVTHVTRDSDTTFNVKRSKVTVTRFCSLGDVLSVDVSADAAVTLRIWIGWSNFLSLRFCQWA